MKGSLDGIAAAGKMKERGGLEEEAYAHGFKRVAGLDEVGRGPWAGPVVAAAVVFPRGLTHPEINDSKLITARKREALAPWIKENALAWGLGVVSSEEIDKINILQASLLAMAVAFRQLRPTPDYLLIDGSHKIPNSFFVDSLTRYSNDEYANNQYTNNERPKGCVPFQMAIKKGDQLSISIAAASIVAKVARDRMMMDYDKLYPEYGFGRHKGYGSPVHLDALNRYGPLPIHRRSFRPVRELVTRVSVNSLFGKRDE